MTPKFIIYRTADNQFYFVLKAPNNEVSLTSEMFTSKEDCYNAIDSVVINAPIADAIDRT